MEHIELLEELRPWDCEQFPKSKNICFGGGGGNPITKVVKEVGGGIGDAVGSVANPVAGGLGEVGKGINEGISGGIGGIGSGLNQVGQGMQGILDPAGQALHGALDRNIGSESAFGRAMSSNMQAINEGISHNIKQVGHGANMIGNTVMGLLGQGRGGGGAGGGGGVMGPMSGGLARMGASKLQMKKAGMGRRQTYLTKG
tara:strand:- start:367 stop:966 length:600 start_codon:yes stop_codon:yes gene_type:complete